MTSDAEAKGQSINGEALRKLRTRLTTQMRSSKDGDLKIALNNINELMLDSIESEMSPEDLSKFKQARTYYRNGMLVRDIVSPEGEVSPSALMSRMRATGNLKMDMARDRAGDLGDLANIGALFLKETPAGSKIKLGELGAGGLGTGIGAMMGAPGAVAGAATAGAGVLGGANLYNRVIAPAITQKLLIPPP